MSPLPPSSLRLEQLLSLLASDNATYIAHLYDLYRTDTSSIAPEWKAYFDTLLVQTLPSHLPKGQIPLNAPPEAILASSIHAMALIHAYRTHGYKVARLDPLNLVKLETPLDLLPKTYGFKAKDEGQPLIIEDQNKAESLPLRTLLKQFDTMYRGPIGMEFMHIENPEQKAWLQTHMEGDKKIPSLQQTPLSLEKKKQTLAKIIDAKNFEQFLHKKYPATHRFSLEGAESLIPGLEEVLLQSSKFGVKEVVMGMTHRGRLNVLANIMNKPLKDIFYQFQSHPSNQVAPSRGTGDVKYHLGASTDRIFNGNKVHISLLDSPSHLEAIDPVVAGKVRAQQALLKDHKHCEVMGILIHGDAAFKGQGIVSETLMLPTFKGYYTGGTLHIIINNQIGFTTTPEVAYSSLYCADLATAFQIPILHVNGDDPEAIINVMRLAAQFRQTFKTDIVVNIVCYRRYGHNEGDEASFTQPLMTKAIADHPSVDKLYTQKLLQEKSVTQAEVNTLEETSHDAFEQSFLEAKHSIPSPQKTHRYWEKLVFHKGDEISPKTGVRQGSLVEIGRALDKVPTNFHLHPKLAHILAARRDMVIDSSLIDWSLAETLAFGSLLLEGYHVRLSGQDSERGTFSQRHAVLIDQKTEEKYIPLNHIAKTQASFEVWNSPLAELSILGFELGYSFASPQSLVLWEAQYGDFSNEAQVIVDQFLSASEAKWLCMSGLVMLLPHGYEGQGPEHSSARLERYLQLCAEDNMQVVNCSTPANYFHVLRRQLHRSYRKPLIIMTPKSLLRHKQAVSSLKDLETGTQFQDVISDHHHSATRIVLCSGKVYYDLLKACTEQNIKDVSLIRLEQLSPFPHSLLLEILKPYPKNAEIIWCQEEPMNMGAWTFIDRRLETVLIELNMKYSRPHYVGRPEAASPATGFAYHHVQEQELLVNQALNRLSRKK